jgi:hypothetical protein
MGIGGLTAAYAMLVGVVASLHIYSRWGFWVKITVTILALVMCIVTYKSLPALQGWPITTDRLPSRLYLLAIEVAEPDSVYLWARDLGDGVEVDVPRAYRIPYSKSLHEQAALAGRKLRKSIAQIVEIDPAGQAVKVPGAAEVPVNQQVIRFVDAPEGLLPPKE